MPERPGLTHLCRLLGRAAADDMDDPDGTSRAALRALVEVRLASVALALVEEAAASDDVADHESAMMFIGARLAEIGDLLDEGQHRRLVSAVDRLTSGWG